MNMKDMKTLLKQLSVNAAIAQHVEGDLTTEDLGMSVTFIVREQQLDNIVETTYEWLGLERHDGLNDIAMLLEKLALLDEV